MRLDEKQQATVDELVKQHHEKVRKAVEDLRTNLVKQIKEAVGDSKGADFERVLNEHAAPPRVPEGPPGPPGPPPGAPPR